MLHRIRFGFRNASAMVIPAIGEKVLAGMRGNPDFPDPPVSMEILEQALDEFSLAIQAQAKGGTLATAMRNNARRMAKSLAECSKPSPTGGVSLPKVRKPFTVCCCGACRKIAAGV